MATLEENLKKARDFLKNNRAADTNGINGFFFSLGVINHTLSMDDSKSIPAVGALLADSLENANKFIPLLAQKVNEVIRAQHKPTLVWIATKIEEVRMDAVRFRIDEFERSNISMADSKEKLEILIRSLGEIHKAILSAISKTEAEMQESEKESREEEEKAHLKYEYVYGWFLFTDEKEKKRCEKKGVVPTKRQLEEKKTVFVAGGRTKKDVEFIRPQLDAPPVERARMAGVKFVGLAVQLLPATGAVEPTLDFITSDSRRKWKWAFMDYGKELPERVIQGRIVSMRMLERLRIFDPARTTGQELNQLFKGHISIGVKNASVPFYSFDGQREAPIGSINLTSNEKGFFKLTFKEGALPIIVHAGKEGRTSRHIDRPWGRGGNQNYPGDPPPAAPIVAAKDMSVAVALDVEPDFSDKLVDGLKRYAEQLKDFRKYFIGVDTLKRKQEVLENMIHNGKDISGYIINAFITLQRMVEEDRIVRDFFIQQLQREVSGVSGMDVNAILAQLMKGEEMKKTIHDHLARQNMRFAFDPDKGRFTDTGSEKSRVESAVNEVIYLYYPPIDRLYKYFDAYLSLFIKLNPGLKNAIQL